MSKSNRINKVLILLIILAFSLGFFTPVLADYIGPNRSVTTYEVEAIDYGVWAKDDPTGTSCTHTTGTDCIVCEWEGSPGRPCGDAEYSYKLGTRYDTVAVTTVYPAATITDTLQNCTLQNGWCVTSPQLQIVANEPVSGYQILLIEGIYNGEIFACAENPCIFPFATEGNHAIEYWTLSSWGDSSTKKTTTIKVDTVSPNLNLLVNGTLGKNNWYVSNTTITAEGVDGTSGIYEKVLSIDNGITWIPSTTLTDGIYQVDIKVTDNAYNVSTTSTIIQVDTVTPTLSLSVSGTKGNHNFYTSNPKITATTTDATSGVAIVQAKVDNGDWIDINEITIEDGIHTYQFRVYDHAGNFTETSLQHIAVDTTPPSVEADEEINLGETIYYTLRDNGSGLSISRIVIEDEDERYKKVVWVENITGDKITDKILWDGKFADKTLAGVGEYFMTFKISDRAGNETFYTTIVNVNPISYLQVIPEFIPPVSDEVTSNESTSELENEETNEQNFGGEQSQTNGSTEQIFELVSGVGNGMASSDSFPVSNILTGAVAVGAIALAMKVVHDAQKKREEEQAQSLQQAKNQADKLNDAEADRKANLWWQGQINNFYDSLPNLVLSETQLQKVLDTLSTQGLRAAQDLADDFNTRNTTSVAPSHSQTTNTPATTSNPFAGVVASGSLGKSSSSDSFFSSLWDAGVNYANDVGNNLLNLAGSLKNSAVGAWNKFTTWANSTYTTLADTIPTFAVSAWNTLSNWTTTTYTNLSNTLSNNPVVTWGTATTITLATAGTIYYVNCHGLPVIMPPTSSVINFAGVFSLPAVGWLTTNKKQRRYGLIIGMLFLGMLLSACGGVPSTQNPNTPTPTLCPPTQTPTQPPTNVPPTGIPSVTDNLNSNYSGLEHLNGWIQQNQAWLIANGYPTDAQYWQNYYNQQIIEIANQYGISPALLKGLILRESNNAVTPMYIDGNGQIHLNYQAGGLVQLTGAGADTIFRYMDTPLADYYYNLAYQYATQGGLALLEPGILYKDLDPDQKLIIQDVVKQMFDGQCVQWEVSVGHCTAEQMVTPLINDGKDNITLGAMNLTATQQDVINYVGQTNWTSLPLAEQQKLIIAMYKGGAGCVGNAIQTAQSVNGGQIQNWSQVEEKLSDGSCINKDELKIYVPSVLCYASNLSETPANSCASPNP